MPLYESRPIIKASNPATAAKQFRPYSFIPGVTDSQFGPPNVWTCSTLPAGLTLNSATGEISGTPTVAGVAVFTMRCILRTTLTGVETNSGVTRITCADTSTLVRFADLHSFAIFPGYGISSVTALVSATQFDVNIAPGATLSGQTVPVDLSDWSDPQEFAIVIEPGIVPVPDGYRGAAWDLVTNAITFDGVTGPPRVKSGDTLLIQLRTVSDGAMKDMDAASMKLSLKFREDQAAVVVGGADEGEFGTDGSGEAKVYRIAASLTGDALAAVLVREGRAAKRTAAQQPDLGAVAADVRAAKFIAMCEIEMTFANTSGVGPNPSILTSDTFELEVVRELTPPA